MRGILVEVSDPRALKALLDRGEEDRELGPSLGTDPCARANETKAGEARGAAVLDVRNVEARGLDLREHELKDGEWLTLTVRVGMRDTRVPARARDLGDGPSLVLSERDWQRLRSFACCCSEDGKISHPPSGVTAIVRGKVAVLSAEPCLGKVVSATLASVGVEAVVFASADDMLEHVKLQRIDVAIVDAQIPDASSIALCNRLHGLPLELRPASLMLVASSSPNGDVRTLTRWADDFLLTPFRRQELAARVTSLLHRAASERGIIGAA